MGYTVCVLYTHTPMPRDETMKKFKLALNKQNGHGIIGITVYEI